MFGAKERHTRSILIRTSDCRNLGSTLEPRSLPLILQAAAELFHAGHHAEAETGLRQILMVDPLHPSALYCLGQMLAARGDHTAAVEKYRTLLMVNPNFHKAWSRLGHSLKALGDLEGGNSCAQRSLELLLDGPRAVGAKNEVARSAESQGAALYT
jgi:tetratricopeptide (TPR) repeat protein